MNKSFIKFCGGVGSVTGANFLVSIGKTKFLVDCGLVQGIGTEDLNYQDFSYNPSEIDFLFVTHAHMDHIGRIPRLVEKGFKGVIYSTKETFEMASLMFDDALKVMEDKVKKEKIKPLYSESSVRKAISLWKTIDYHTNKQFDDFSVYLKDAGHILGSSMYEFTFDLKNKKTKLVFTGDSGNSPSPLLRDTEIVNDANFMVIDSVYGDRNHESKKERDEKFLDIVSESIKSGGTLVIPAFSIERTQVILYMLNNFVEDGLVPSVPVYLDSPLASKITKIYQKSDYLFNSSVLAEIKNGDNIFSFPKLSIVAKHIESENIKNIDGPKIIIAGSGMSEGGRIVNHEIHFLPDPKSTILLMGYQAVGTLGRKIFEGDKNIQIGGNFIEVKAKISSISGYSSHKDSDSLVDMVADSQETLKKVFVVMGEYKSSTFLAQKIRDNIDVEAICPQKDQVYFIE